MSRVTLCYLSYLMQTVCETVCIIVDTFLCFFDVSLASTLGLAEVFQKYQQSIKIKNHDNFKMYQYHDTLF